MRRFAATSRPAPNECSANCTRRSSATAHRAAVRKIRSVRGGRRKTRLKPNLCRSSRLVRAGAWPAPPRCCRGACAPPARARCRRRARMTSSAARQAPRHRSGASSRAPLCCADTISAWRTRCWAPARSARRVRAPASAACVREGAVDVDLQISARAMTTRCAQVYKARDVHTGEPVAIKLLGWGAQTTEVRAAPAQRLPAGHGARARGGGVCTRSAPRCAIFELPHDAAAHVACTRRAAALLRCARRLRTASCCVVRPPHACGACRS